MNPKTPAWGGWSLSQWTTREVPQHRLLMRSSTCFFVSWAFEIQFAFYTCSPSRFRRTPSSALWGHVRWVPTRLKGPALELHRQGPVPRLSPPRPARRAPWGLSCHASHPTWASPPPALTWDVPDTAPTVALPSSSHSKRGYPSRSVYLGAFLVVQWVKNLPCNARGVGSIPSQGTKTPHAMGQLSL